MRKTYNQLLKENSGLIFIIKSYIEYLKKVEDHIKTKKEPTSEGTLFELCRSSIEYLEKGLGNI